MASGTPFRYQTMRYGLPRIARGCGFTLIELIVAVAILSILVTLALPSFRTMIINNRMTSQANQLLQLVTFARSEAIRRNRTVVMCIAAGDNGQGCAATATDWATGVTIFSDRDGDFAFDSADGDQVIEVRRPLASQMTITGGGSITRRLSFSPSGLITTGSGSLSLTSSVNSYTKQLAIGPTGRPRIE